MDQETRGLERAFAASPADAGLARRLVTALVRDGREGDAFALLKTKYVCASTWESLGQGYQRSCPSCGDLVALALDEKEALERLGSGRGVAVPLGARELVLSCLTTDGRFHAGQERRAPRIHLDGSPSTTSFRALAMAVMSYQGESLADVVLEPALTASHLAVFRHAAFRRRAWCERAGAPATARDLWELYALLRIHDVLLNRALSENGLDLPEFTAFFESLGMARLRSERAFSPLHHEIAAVQATSGDSVEIASEAWPGLAFGDLVFARAGVTVRAPRALLAPDTAGRSKLLFAYARANRECEDLSSGWGSNSQWRTELPRFYDEPGRHLFNVDGKTDLGSPLATGDGQDPLPLERRRELLVHRSCVREPEILDITATLFDRLAVRDDGGPLWPLDPERVVPLPPARLAAGDQRVA